MLDRFLSTLSVVSRVPVKWRFKFDSSRMDFYLPLAGICAALPGFLIFTGVSLWFDFSQTAPARAAPARAALARAAPAGISALTAAVILLVQYLGFNLFHLDGLMDTADAFLGGAERKKRLAILKDSRTGVYGFFAGFTVLSFKGILLCTLLPLARGFPALVFAWPLWGRFSAALVPCMAKPLHPGGLGALTKDARLHRCVGGAALALILWALLVWGLLNAAALTGSLPFIPQCAGSAPPPVLIAAAASPFGISALAALYYARLYQRTLGGYTGDALGAAVETSELLCMAAVLAALYAGQA
ncbi:MAG: adenosylcobinamide-GDP ribazoletransferase [Treponema sp.]|jgi:adenosylcobinamide-GDP ribazoletransferase|nr:adenosylcobinamide-GDP ribazoletransferase [Treponema sp.]